MLEWNVQRRQPSTYAVVGMTKDARNQLLQPWTHTLLPGELGARSRSQLALPWPMLVLEYC